MNLNDLARDINEWARNKGFWDFWVENPVTGDQVTIPPNHYLVKAAKLALVTTETSEQVEAVRKPNSASGLPGYSNEVEEAADQIIRILDYCGQYGLDIHGAVLAKMEVNSGRPYKHNKVF